MGCVCRVWVYVCVCRCACVRVSQVKRTSQGLLGLVKVLAQLLHLSVAVLQLGVQLLCAPTNA
jgi:hypothetical protein